MFSRNIPTDATSFSYCEGNCATSIFMHFLCFLNLYFLYATLPLFWSSWFFGSKQIIHLNILVQLFPALLISNLQWLRNTAHTFVILLSRVHVYVGNKHLSSTENVTTVHKNDLYLHDLTHEDCFYSSLLVILGDINIFPIYSCFLILSMLLFLLSRVDTHAINNSFSEYIKNK